MKKVLFVATVVKTHINVFHLPYLKLFKDWGWETSVCAKDDFGEEESCEIPNCDKYYNLPFERFPFKINNLVCYRKIKKIIKEQQYDIIHCHTPVGGVIARLAARFAGINKTKVIYTAHGFHFFKGAALKNWLIYYPIEWLCSFFTDVLITINKEDYNFAKKHLHAKDIKYVPGVGVDVEQIKMVDVDEMEKRSELGLTPNDIMILSVGELTTRKNHKIIIEALSRLKNDNIHYFIVGSGEKREELAGLTKNLKIEQNVHFLGFRNDVFELCKTADIFCFPSLQEGLPVALMEAMCAGLPVICSNIRGNTDLIENELGGILCSHSNVDEFAEGVRKLSADELLRNKMGIWNLKRIKDYDICNICTLMKEIYKKYN